MVQTYVAVLKIGLGLETTFQGSQSRRLGGIFTRPRLGLGFDGFRIFDQDRSGLSQHYNDIIITVAILRSACDTLSDTAPHS